MRPKQRSKEYGEDDEPRGPSTLTGGKETEEDAVSDQFGQSDIDLNISYSDSDKEVPFK